MISLMSIEAKKQIEERTGVVLPLMSEHHLPLKEYDKLVYSALSALSRVIVRIKKRELWVVKLE